MVEGSEGQTSSEEEQIFDAEEGSGSESTEKPPEESIESFDFTKELKEINDKRDARYKKLAELKEEITHKAGYDTFKELQEFADESKDELLLILLRKIFAKGNEIRDDWHNDVESLNLKKEKYIQTRVRDIESI
mgnify:CR=1 FL=1